MIRLALQDLYLFHPDELRIQFRGNNGRCCGSRRGAGVYSGTGASRSIPPLEALHEPEPRAAHLGVARWICVGVLALGVDKRDPRPHLIGLVSGTQFVPVPLRAELRRDVVLFLSRPTAV